MKTKIAFHVTIAGLATILFTGCTATLQHGQFNGAIAAPKGEMGVMTRAKNMPNRIGWGTFTVFAIPIAPVKVEGEADRELMNQVKAAVEHCGYTAKLVDDPSQAAGLPLLSCNVEEIGFKNYTYFFPLVFNWGEIKMNIAINSPDGKLIWYRSCAGKGGGAYSFSPTVNKALTISLNDMIPDLAALDLNSPTRRVCPVLKSSNPGEVVRMLKLLRKMNAPDAVPEILPLLQDANTGVVRDACRTLAVLGNKGTIASIEPLLSHKQAAVRKDAQDAIVALRAKS